MNDKKGPLAKMRIQRICARREGMSGAAKMFLSCVEMRRLQRNLWQGFIPSVMVLHNTIVIAVLQDFWQLWHGGRIERLSKFNAKNYWPDLMNNDIEMLQLTN